MRNDSSHFAVQIELLGPSLKNFFLLLKKINFNEYEFIWQTQFRQYGCYLVPKITTASQQQTMNEGTITAQSHRTQGQKEKKKNQEKAGVVFKDSKVGPVGTGAKSFSSLSRSKSYHFMRP